jgi:hypothetical protein
MYSGKKTLKISFNTVSNDAKFETGIANKTEKR